MIRLTEVSSIRGAPMGRRSFHCAGATHLHFELERVPLVDDAYDAGGAYWGSPDNLWCAQSISDDEVVQFYLRADDEEMAVLQVQDEYPDATFAPQTGSIIEQTIELLQKYLDGLDPEDRELAAGTEEDIGALEDELYEIKWRNK